MTGVDKLAIKSKSNVCPPEAKFSASETEKCANSLMSAPATKAFSPLPVIIITFVLIFSSAFLKARCSS